MSFQSKILPENVEIQNMTSQCLFITSIFENAIQKGKSVKPGSRIIFKKNIDCYYAEISRPQFIYISNSSKSLNFNSESDTYSGYLEYIDLSEVILRIILGQPQKIILKKFIATEVIFNQEESHLYIALANKLGEC